MKHRWKKMPSEAASRRWGAVPGVFVGLPKARAKPRPRWRCSVCGAVVACKRSQRSRRSPDCGDLVAQAVHAS